MMKRCIIGALAVVFALVCAIHADESADSKARQLDSEKLEAARKDAQKHISVLTLNLFHEHCIDRLFPPLSEDVRLNYCGMVATDDGHKPWRLAGGGRVSTVDWSVGGEITTFRFWISREKTSQTVTKVRINEEDIFVNVNFVDEDRGIDAKLPELGDRSVREVLKLLETRRQD